MCEFFSNIMQDLSMLQSLLVHQNRENTQKRALLKSVFSVPSRSMQLLKIATTLNL
jgi:hypothetical protein